LSGLGHRQSHNSIADFGDRWGPSMFHDGHAPSSALACANEALSLACAF
jgi:hypothetical protein